MPNITISIPTAQLADLDQLAVAQGYANYRDLLINITKDHVFSQELAKAIDVARIDATVNASRKSEAIK